MSKKNDGAPQSMDPNAREVRTPEAITHQPRVCWAIKQLVSEVNSLFPETPVEYSEVDGRNTALAVTFDLTGLDMIESGQLSTLLGLVDSDDRVLVALTDTSAVFVQMRSNPRTQDKREPFGLAEALDVLSDDSTLAWVGDES